MRKLQELFYKIGRIVNFVMVGIYGLLVIIETIRLIIDAAAGCSAGVVGGHIGAMIGYLIAAGFAIALIFLDKKYANDALKAKNDALTPVIILMIFGLFVAFWCYVVGGVFGIIAASQENGGNKQEEKKEEKAE